MAFANDQIRIISLFSGTGMLDRAVASALARFGLTARTVCYVENNPAAHEVIRARVRDGLLHDAPIWPDVVTFPGARFRGHVDGIVAGFPCQPFSVAGKRDGEADERYLFGEVVRVADEVGAQLLWLENVPGILLPMRVANNRYGDYRDPLPDGEESNDYWQRMSDVESGRIEPTKPDEVGDGASGSVQPAPVAGVLRLLSESGFNAAWLPMGAADVGAPHGRQRWWCIAWREVADSDGRRVA